MPFLTLEQNCEQVDIWVREKLTHAGLRVIPTFDLQIARLGHSDCPCPNHGTEQCSCQLVILLVYDEREGPATLVIHGQDDKAWLSMVTPIHQRSGQSLEILVRDMLFAQLSDSNMM